LLRAEKGRKGCKDAGGSSKGHRKSIRTVEQVLWRGFSDSTKRHLVFLKRDKTRLPSGARGKGTTISIKSIRSAELLPDVDGGGTQLTWKRKVHKFLHLGRDSKKESLGYHHKTVLFTGKRRRGYCALPGKRSSRRGSTSSERGYVKDLKG